jgi:hypothetical protein
MNLENKTYTDSIRRLSYKHHDFVLVQNDILTLIIIGTVFLLYPFVETLSRDGGIKHAIAGVFSNLKQTNQLYE